MEPPAPHPSTVVLKGEGAAMFTSHAVNAGNQMSVTGRVLHCTGNLVVNGGFEEGLAAWHAANVRVVTGKETHEGRGAAGLGAYRCNRRSALLFQDVTIPRDTPHQFFQVLFHVGGFKDRPAPLSFCLLWLDEDKHILTSGAHARIQPRAIGNASRGKWTTYALITNEAPREAAFARLRFAKRPGRRRRNFVVIDDIVMMAVAPTCLLP